MYLTRKEYELMEALPAYFTLAEVSDATGMPKKYAGEVIARLVLKDALVRPKSGVFLKASEPSRNFEYNYGLALAGGKAFVALASALKVHGLMDEELSEYQFATENTDKSREFRGKTYTLVPFGKDYYGIEEIRGIAVSTRAKTFYDCLCRMRLVGAAKLASILKLSPPSKKEWNEILLFFQDKANKSLKQRLGFFLSKIAPEFFLKGLETQIGSKAVVRMSPSARTLDRRWMVYYEHS